VIAAITATTISVLLAMVLVAVRRRFVVVRVVGTSMQPTLRDGERVLVRRTELQRVRRGQLVVFASFSLGPDSTVVPAMPGDPPWLVKRAIALPGDPVPHEQVPLLRDATLAQVPPGRIVVLGDNQSASFDSRRAGYIDGNTLLGIVVRTLPTSAS
jgi:signal peptidase I